MVVTPPSISVVSSPVPNKKCLNLPYLDFNDLCLPLPVLKVNSFPPVSTSLAIESLDTLEFIPNALSADCVWKKMYS